jgi:hypothetical protein
VDLCAPRLPLVGAHAYMNPCLGGRKSILDRVLGESRVRDSCPTKVFPARVI